MNAGAWRFKLMSEDELDELVERLQEGIDDAAERDEGERWEFLNDRLEAVEEERDRRNDCEQVGHDYEPTFRRSHFAGTVHRRCQRSGCDFVTLDAPECDACYSDEHDGLFPVTVNEIQMIFCRECGGEEEVTG